METLIALRGPDLLRVKGFLNVTGCRGPVLVQIVQHLAHPPVELAAWPDHDHTSRLVFITRNIPQERILALLQAVRALAVDTPGEVRSRPRPYRRRAPQGCFQGRRAWTHPPARFQSPDPRVRRSDARWRTDPPLISAIQGDMHLMARITLDVNGTVHTIDADPDMPLLYALRNDLNLNNPHFGCGLAQCGACTVHIDPARRCSST